MLTLRSFVLNYFKSSILIVIIVLLVLLSLFTGCDNDGTDNGKRNGNGEKLNIVTTFSVLEDITKHIAGDKVNIINIVGRDADAHVYNPTPEITKLLCEADLVIENGLGFEGWIKRLISSSCYRGKIVTASDGVKVSYMDCDCKKHIYTSPSSEPTKLFQEEGGTENKKIIDPHAWHDVRNAMIYAKNIKNALVEIDPKNKDFYEKRYNNYYLKLKNLDEWVERKLKIKRCSGITVITAHDAFFYYGKRYNIKFIALQGISTDSSPSARDIADVVDTIRRYHISAIFSENIANSKLIQQVAKEAKVKIGGELYSDSLSSNGDAATYLDMIRYNTNLITSTLCSD